MGIHSEVRGNSLGSPWEFAWKSVGIHSEVRGNSLGSPWELAWKSVGIRLESVGIHSEVRGNSLDLGFQSGGSGNSHARQDFHQKCFNFICFECLSSYFVFNFHDFGGDCVIWDNSLYPHLIHSDAKRMKRTAGDGIPYAFHTQTNGKVQIMLKYCQVRNYFIVTP